MNVKSLFAVDIGVGVAVDIGVGVAVDIGVGVAVDIGVGVPVTYGWFVFHSRVYPHPTSLGDESSQPVENTSRRMQFSGHTKGLRK